MRSLAALLLPVLAAGAQSATSAPSFELGYRAWDLVTELARANGDPAIAGECGKTFRPFVIPGLRRQTREQEDAAAAACVAAARAACADSRLRKPVPAAQCEDFR